MNIVDTVRTEFEDLLIIGGHSLDQNISETRDYVKTLDATDITDLIAFGQVYGGRHLPIALMVIGLQTVLNSIYSQLKDEKDEEKG